MSQPRARQVKRRKSRSVLPNGLLLVVFAVSLSVIIGFASAQSAPAAAPVSTVRQSALVNAVNAERRYFELPGFGAVAYYVDPRGTGRPLLLTSSINAAASAYEMKPVFDTYAGTRPVYVLEWPGFGSSDRPDTRYTADLMTRALSAMVQKIGVPVDLVALSLGSEFAARSALSEPGIASVALISPSGMGLRRGGSQRAANDDGGVKLYGNLSRFGTPLFALIRSPLSIRYFLSRSFVGEPDPGLVAYSGLSSNQPGGKYAPLYFISGQLFTPGAYDTLYSKVTQPVLVIYDKDNFVTFERLAEFDALPNVSAARIVPSAGLPQFEKLAEVKAALDSFWAAPTP
jgi:pimeloyl-ACP methyl ester carboxylesterase